jgi:GMP synthase-like glutamine amidotransferase
MRVGLLVCDHVRDEFRGVAGDYPDMFEALLGDQLELVPYHLVDGEFPASPGDCDGWITTGSRQSVYDDIPWVQRFAQLTRDIAGSDRRLVGVCFGQQMIAHALGGKVEQAPQGWGVGIKEVSVVHAEPWMEPPTDSFRILNSHRDQVTVLPTGGRVVGSNEHCPVSAMSVGERIIGIQGHPEFVPEYSAALMESRRGWLIPDEVVDAGIASLGAGPDRRLLTQWIVRFLVGETPDPVLIR